MIRTLGDTGINWNWYLSADFNKEEKTAQIIFHDRWHKWEDNNHPEAEWLNGWRPFELLEDKNRIVYGIKLEGIEYLVTNPDSIFEYKFTAEI